jgi:hypothetical protein
MLDADLAELYGVEVKVLNQAVRRNKERFPEDFVRRISAEEARILRSQSVTSRSGWGGRRHPPFAFTEQGVAMLSSVLRSRRAAQVNVEIMRAFVRMRALIGQHRDLSRRLEALERKYDRHDRKFAEVFEAIRELMAPEIGSGTRIGFRTDGTD